MKKTTILITFWYSCKIVEYCIAWCDKICLKARRAIMKKLKLKNVSVTNDTLFSLNVCLANFANLKNYKIQMLCL